MCEIIGVIAEIVSNQYHLLVLIQKVIAPSVVTAKIIFAVFICCTGRGRSA